VYHSAPGFAPRNHGPSRNTTNRIEHPFFATA